MIWVIFKFQDKGYRYQLAAEAAASLIWTLNQFKKISGVDTTANLTKLEEDYEEFTEGIKLMEFLQNDVFDDADMNLLQDPDMEK